MSDYRDTSAQDGGLKTDLASTPSIAVGDCALDFLAVSWLGVFNTQSYALESLLPLMEIAVSSRVSGGNF